MPQGHRPGKTIRHHRQSVHARGAGIQSRNPPLITIGTPILWTLFAAFVLIALLVDFFAMNKQGAHKVSIREASIWSAIWVAVSCAFAGWLWWYLGGPHGDAVADAKALEFVTGYLVEKALAVDNIFVFLMLFTYFAVPAEFQKRVLMFGILGALVLRAGMILIGAWLIAQFHWVLYVFGAFLVFTGVKMWWAAGQEPDLDRNPALNWVRRHLTISPVYDGEKFFTVFNGVRMATPLFLVIFLTGIVDIVFAVDSIPAIFAITTDPFIVLMFIGAKMLLIDIYKIPVAMSLFVTVAVLAATMILSLRIPPVRKSGTAYPFKAKDAGTENSPSPEAPETV